MRCARQLVQLCPPASSCDKEGVLFANAVVNGIGAEGIHHPLSVDNELVLDPYWLVKLQGMVKEPGLPQRGQSNAVQVPLIKLTCEGHLPRPGVMVDKSAGSGDPCRAGAKPLSFRSHL